MNSKPAKYHDAACRADLIAVPPRLDRGCHGCRALALHTATFTGVRDCFDLAATDNAPAKEPTT